MKNKSIIFTKRFTMQKTLDQIDSSCSTTLASLDVWDHVWRPVIRQHMHVMDIVHSAVDDRMDFDD